MSIRRIEVLEVWQSVMPATRVTTTPLCRRSHCELPNIRNVTESRISWKLNKCLTHEHNGFILTENVSSELRSLTSFSSRLGPQSGCVVGGDMNRVVRLWAFSLFFVAISAFGQRDLGTITGTITDPQSA